MDIVAASGTLRVTLRPNRRALLIQAAGAAILAIMMDVPKWAGRGYLAILVCVLLLALIFSDVVVSETIEIDDQKLVVRRKNLAWTRTSEYEIDACTDFQASLNGEWIRHCALWCKVGGRVISFGRDMSDDQAAQVILELKRNLPRAAHRLLMHTDLTDLAETST